MRRVRCKRECCQGCQDERSQLYCDLKSVGEGGTRPDLVSAAVRSRIAVIARGENCADQDAFERKIQRANEAGFVVALVGLMEPVDRYPESAAACLFARHMVARLFGNFVIFSPSFDSRFIPLADEVGLDEDQRCRPLASADRAALRMFTRL